MKILAIDYGTKRIGLAISDETQTLAREYDIYSPKAFWESIDRIVTTETVGLVIVGWPLGMTGQVTQKTQETRDFVNRLKDRLPVPVDVVDERLSSVMATQFAGTKRNIDSLAAQIFLQNYLDSKK